MKRRDFLKRTGAFASAPLILNGIPAQSMSHVMNMDNDISDRVLIIVLIWSELGYYSLTLLAAFEFTICFGIVIKRKELRSSCI